jgi:hypothetical protein
MTLELFDHVKFLHPVGISTCKYGVTIPLEAQTARMLAIAKGAKVSVTIFLGGDEPVLAEIRRLNNQPGHLQFRYEKKAQERLRQGLTRIFDGGATGNLLEVEEIAPLVFRFKPILKTTSPRLHISDLLLHRVKQAEVNRIAEVEQVGKTLAGVIYNANFSQLAYNGLIKEHLKGQGWTTESRVVDELGLRCDFEKNGVWVEVEFGNARSYYQDYVKFMLAKQFRSARLGMLLCPTASFAGLLCELGRKRAEVNNVREQAASYGGMMCFEKAARELPYLGFMFDMPIVIAGVGVCVS